MIAFYTFTIILTVLLNFFGGKKADKVILAYALLIDAFVINQIFNPISIGDYFNANISIEYSLLSLIMSIFWISLSRNSIDGKNYIFMIIKSLAIISIIINNLIYYIIVLETLTIIYFYLIRIRKSIIFPLNLKREMMIWLFIASINFFIVNLIINLKNVDLNLGNNIDDILIYINIIPSVFTSTVIISLLVFGIVYKLPVLSSQYKDFTLNDGLRVKEFYYFCQFSICIYFFKGPLSVFMNNNFSITVNGTLSFIYMLFIIKADSRLIDGESLYSFIWDQFSLMTIFFMFYTTSLSAIWSCFLYFLIVLIRELLIKNKIIKKIGMLYLWFMICSFVLVPFLINHIDNIQLRATALIVVLIGVIRVMKNIPNYKSSELNNA